MTDEVDLFRKVHKFLAFVVQFDNKSNREVTSLCIQYVLGVTKGVEHDFSIIKSIWLKCKTFTIMHYFWCVRIYFETTKLIRLHIKKKNWKRRYYGYCRLPCIGKEGTMYAFITCDWICESPPVKHTMTRHSFHCQLIALSINKLTNYH